MIHRQTWQFFCIVMCSSLLMSCVAGPSSEEKAELERIALEEQQRAAARQAKAKAEQEAIQRLLMTKRSDLQNNTPTINRSTTDQAGDIELLNQLEKLVRLRRQTDSPPALEILKERNPMFGKPSSIVNSVSPMFVLDVNTGKLTVRLSSIESRQLMLRHVESVAIVPNEMNFNGVVSRVYAIELRMGQDVIRTQNNARWKDELMLSAESESTANEIKSILEQLVERLSQF